MRKPGLTALFPWGVEAGLRSSALTAGCGIGLVLAWYQVGGRGVFDDQVTGLTVAVLILMVSFYAQASLVVQGRRAIGERRASLLNDSLVSLLPVAAAPGSSEVGRSRRADDDAHERAVLVGDGLRMYHAPGRPMAEGRHVVLVRRDAAEAQGRDACGICLHPRLSAPIVAAQDPA